MQQSFHYHFPPPLVFNFNTAHEQKRNDLLPAESAKRSQRTRRNGIRVDNRAATINPEYSRTDWPPSQCPTDLFSFERIEKLFSRRRPGSVYRARKIPAAVLRIARRALTPFHSPKLDTLISVLTL